MLRISDVFRDVQGIRVFRFVKFFNPFFKISLEDIGPFWVATDTSVFDLLLCLSLVSKPDRIPWVLLPPGLYWFNDFFTIYNLFKTSGSPQARKSAGEIHSGFEIHEEGHTKSKTGAISGSTKSALVQQKIKKKNYLKLDKY